MEAENARAETPVPMTMPACLEIRSHATGTPSRQKGP
jgi:hypothetical protein